MNHNAPWYVRLAATLFLTIGFIAFPLLAILIITVSTIPLGSPLHQLIHEMMLRISGTCFLIYIGSIFISARYDGDNLPEINRQFELLFTACFGNRFGDCGSAS